MEVIVGMKDTAVDPRFGQGKAVDYANRGRHLGGVPSVLLWSEGKPPQTVVEAGELRDALPGGDDQRQTVAPTPLGEVVADVCRFLRRQLEAFSSRVVVHPALYSSALSIFQTPG